MDLNFKNGFEKTAGVVSSFLGKGGGKAWKKSISSKLKSGVNKKKSMFKAYDDAYSGAASKATPSKVVPKKPLATAAPKDLATTGMNPGREYRAQGIGSHRKLKVYS